MSNFINRPTTTPLAGTTPMMAGTTPMMGTTTGAPAMMPGAVATTVLPATTGNHHQGEKLSWHEKRAIKHHEKAIKHENKALQHGHGHGLHQTTTDQKGLLPGGHNHAAATGTPGHATVGQKIKGTVKEVQGAVTHNPVKKEEGRLLKQGIEPTNTTNMMGNTTHRI